jgi:hypothetical protein
MLVNQLKWKKSRRKYTERERVPYGLHVTGNSTRPEKEKYNGKSEDKIHTKQQIF